VAQKVSGVEDLASGLFWGTGRPRGLVEDALRRDRWRREAKGPDPIKRRIARFALAQAEGKRGKDLPAV
jgi:hypothetical protein